MIGLSLSIQLFRGAVLVEFLNFVFQMVLIVGQDLSIAPSDYGDEIGSEVENYLDDIHRDVSRTFDAALQKLSGDLRRQVQVGYLMCRIPDTIEDSSQLDGEEKYELLNRYREVLEEPDQRNVAEFVRDTLSRVEPEEDSSYWDLVKNTHTVTSSFQTFDEEVQGYMKDAVDEMSKGMADFSRKAYQNGKDGIRIHTFDELHEYCHYVAGTVGELLTGVFSHHEETPEELWDNYEDFGQYLQTVNIIKDPVEDLEEESAIFIPEEPLEENLDHNDLEQALRNRNSEVVNPATMRMLERAEQKSDGAQEYIEMIPEDSEIRGYLEVPFLLAKATGREARNNPESVLDGELAVEKEEVLNILGEAGRNDLNQITDTISERPLQQAD